VLFYENSLKVSRKPFSFSSIVLLIALALPLAIPHANAATGLVCIADPSVNPASCPGSPASFSGVVGSNVTVAVNIQGSDTVNGFDISTLVDSSVLQPVNILVANSIIHDPKFILTQTADPNSGIARLAMVAAGYSLPGPVTGNLFTIVYRVLASNRGTGIVFQTGCSGTSVPNTCVTITSPNVDSESVQSGSLVGPVTPNFAISADLPSQTLQAGSSTFTNVRVNSLNGFSGTVNLSTSPPPVCPGCPTWSVAPTSVSLTSGGAAAANVTFHTTSNTPPNTYNVAVNGTSGSISHSVFLSFTVTAPPPPPDFSIFASPASQNVQSGKNATSSIVLTSLNGFSGAINLSVPPQLTCPGCPGWSINPTSVTLSSGGQASSTLTFTTTAGGSTGTFGVNVTGTSGSISHSTVASFTIVTTPPQTGVVCIADVSTTTCPSLPVNFQGTVGGQLQVAVNIFNSSALNGFDVQVLVNPSVLRPVSTSLTGTVLPSPVIVLANSVNATSGLVRVAAVSQGGITVAPTTGRFFSITYNVVGATSGSFILFPAGCSGTSNDGICVIVTNPNVSGGVDPENILEANVTVSAPPTFSISANPTSLSIIRGQSASSAINVTSLNGFAGTITLSTTISPSIRKGPTVSLTPTSITLVGGGTATATLLVSTNGGTQTGTYTITITATSGSLTQTATVTVTILPRH
jgi:hypothetical protein